MEKKEKREQEKDEHVEARLDKVELAVNHVLVVFQPCMQIRFWFLLF
jgi:hypothetical protein